MVIRQDGARLCLGVHSERQGAVNANCSKMNPIRYMEKSFTEKMIKH